MTQRTADEVRSEMSRVRAEMKVSYDQYQLTDLGEKILRLVAELAAIERTQDERAG